MQNTFPSTSPFASKGYANFAKTLLANLLGGLGFFHGDTKVLQVSENDADPADLGASEDADADTKITTIGPGSLLSFTPSRSSFPRGFLWDEGFHLLTIIEWDLDLAVNVLQSWLGRMDNDGWIARQQILGPEARDRVVTEKAQAHHPHHANPPTFIALVLPALLGKLTLQTPYHGYTSKYITYDTERNALLKELYPALSKHYTHFRRTQAGPLNKATHPLPDGAVDGESYRWRGRTPHHTLASGLDDYPRFEPPSPTELHADALAWVAASAKALLQLTEILKLNKDAAIYRTHLRNSQKNLDVLHWSDHKGAYCDATLSDQTGELKHACHVGYASLMPLLLGLMDASHPRLPALLGTLGDPAKLLSAHGLRSLSARDAMYGNGDSKAWRGAVWMNLNTLAVLRLRDLGVGGSAEALALAEDLRLRVVGTVYDSWEKTGVVWEQYHDVNGEGKRSRGFTGWTATVLLLLGLEFVVNVPSGGESAQVVQPLDGANLDQGMKKPEPMAATQTILIWIAVMLLIMLVRRRLLRLVGRVTGSWKARGRRRSHFEDHRL